MSSRCRSQTVKRVPGLDISRKTADDVAHRSGQSYQAGRPSGLTPLGRELRQAICHARNRVCSLNLKAGASVRGHEVDEGVVAPDDGTSQVVIVGVTSTFSASLSLLFHCKTAAALT